MDALLSTICFGRTFGRMKKVFYSTPLRGRSHMALKSALECYLGLRVRAPQTAETEPSGWQKTYYCNDHHDYGSALLSLKEGLTQHR